MIFAFFLIFFQNIFFSNYNSKIIKYMANFATQKNFAIQVRTVHFSQKNVVEPKKKTCLFRQVFLYYIHYFTSSKSTSVTSSGFPLPFC